MNYGFMKIAAGAAPLRVADCTYNRAQIADAIMHYANNGVEVIFFPQLCITGSTCGDLFFQKTLSDGALNSLLYIADATSKCDILSFLGLPYLYDGKLYNCMAAIYHGKVLGLIPSSCTASPVEPNSKYFTRWHGDNIKINLNNCETYLGTRLLFCPSSHSAKISCTPLLSADAGSVYTSHAFAGANIIGICAAMPETVSLFNSRKAYINSESSRLTCAVAAAYAGEGESTTDYTYSGYCQISSCGADLSDTPIFSRAFSVSDVDTDYICFERSKNGFPAQCDDYTQISFDLPCKNLSLIKRYGKNPYLPQNMLNISDFCQNILTVCSHALAKRIAHSNSTCAVIGISGGLDSCLALITTVKAFTILKMPLDKIFAVSMPCFGTSERTKHNAELLCSSLNVTLKEINIRSSVLSHFSDIEHPENQHDVTFENAQARMRTMVLMDIANKNGGLVVGTGDMSELALGWATYGGDHMSMYGVNAGIPKTIIRIIISHLAQNVGADFKQALMDILETPVSPELLPPSSGDISQKTEDIVGPYELHDFFIYYIVRCGFSPKKVFALAANAFEGMYEKPVIFKWLTNFYNRFFAQQFKRSCMPDGPMVFDFSLSPRFGLTMPSDAAANLWKEELRSFENEI